MNQYLGAASACSIVINIFVGVLADQVNFQRFLTPFFVAISVCNFVLFFIKDMKGTLAVVILAISTSLTLSGGSVVT